MKKILALFTLALLMSLPSAYAQYDRRDGQRDGQRDEREREAHRDDSYRLEDRRAELHDPRFHRHPNLRRGHSHLLGRFPHHHHGDRIHTERQWRSENQRRDDRRDGPGRNR